VFISDFAIRKPIVTIVSMAALVLFGLVALLRLDVDEFPELEVPVVSVAIPYPGASPDVVEREVVDRLEDEFGAISGLNKVRSVSTDGFATITVEFEFTKDIQEASQDVRDAISAVRSELPLEMKEPIIRRFDPNDQPIVSLTLSSTTLDRAAMTQLADPGISRALGSIPGVAQVNVVGGTDRELTVQLRPADLQAAGVSVAEVVLALASQNLAAPVGRVSGPLEERTIRLQGRLREPAEFSRLVIAQRGGSVIRLGQVANVIDGAEEARTVALFDGREAIGLDVVKTRRGSTTNISRAIVERVADLQRTLPEGTRLDIVRNSGERVTQSVRNVEWTLYESALLTILVVFLFLASWRSTVITGLALPVSVLAAFIAVWVFGFTLNTMSLLGLSLAIGILVDDAIVVRENIVRHVEMGLDHYIAAKKGTAEIGLAVSATTFAVVAVFVPIGFLSAEAGQWFKPFALTIAAAVLVSLLVSFSLDPMLSAYWPEPHRTPGQRPNALMRAVHAFNRWFDRFGGRYRVAMAWALGHRKTVLAGAALSFVGAIVLQGMFGGGGFVPDSDRSEITVQLETPPGSNLAYTRLRAEEVDRLLRAIPEVRHTYATVGSATGTGAVDEAQVYVRLVPKADRARKQKEVAADVRRRAREIAGVTTTVFSSGFGGGEKQIQVNLRGPDLGVLTEVGERIAAEVRQVPGAADVGTSTGGQKPELDVQLNRGLAGSLGVTLGQVAQALRPAFAGIDASDWVDPSGRTRNVFVRLAPESRRNVADLAQLPLVVGVPGTPTMAMLPLGQIATITTSLGPAQIDRLNQERVVVIGANAEGRSVQEVARDIGSRIGRLAIPPGYRVSQGGEEEQRTEVFGQILTALAAAVMLMYLILVIQFGSFLDPLAILFSLPLSLIGVVLALLLTGDTLNIMSMIGVILLMGIVAKNAILLIDFAKAARARGVPRRAALLEAGGVRLRPILMTTVALIAGMVPVALGSGEGGDFRAPLGRAVIGGTITSTLLTLIVIPVAYEVLDDWRERGKAILRRLASRGIVPRPEPEAMTPKPLVAD